MLSPAISEAETRKGWKKQRKGEGVNEEDEEEEEGNEEWAEN